MSSAIDPFFLFENPTNLASLEILLEPEKFEVIDVKKAVGPCNNTIATIDILTESEDEDGLPTIVKTGVRRELMYDRQHISDALKSVLSMDSVTKTLYVNLMASDLPDTYHIYRALVQNGIDVGRDAITVTHIANTDIVHIETNNKSIRFYGDMMIAFKTL